MRVVVLADSDSYVKWGAALAGTLPPGWERELFVVESRFTVNDTQLREATAGTGMTAIARVAVDRLAGRLADRAADVVLVAAPGPVTQVLVRLVADQDPRPVIVAGMPGIAIPVTVKALRFRRQADLMIVHSRREVREFAALSAARGWDHRLGLARLPFAAVHAQRPLGDDLVFAAQAIVPRERGDRLAVARMLLDAARADPRRRVVVKLRARPGERSTHPEADGYPELLAALGPLPRNLEFATGAMADALDTAAGLVTVSSTALLEAVARGIPAIAIDTFGVSRALINPVFEGSGLFGGRDEVIARRFRHPDPAWVDENYFHAEDDWIPTLEHLVAARRRGALPARAPHVPPGGALRAAWDRRQALGAADRSWAGRVALVVGIPARGVLRAARRLSERWSLRASAG